MKYASRNLLGFIAIVMVLAMSPHTLANFGPPLHERPQPLKVTTSEAKVTEIHIPKRLLPAGGFGGVERNESPLWTSPAAIRTVIAGLLLSAAAVVGLVLLRNRQTKLATAALLVAAVSLGVLGVLGTSVADIAPPPPPQEVAADKAEVVLKFVDGDTVTIIKGTSFPK